MASTVSTTDAPPPSGAYPQGVASGQLLFISGQARCASTGASSRVTFPSSLGRSCATLDRIAVAAGTSIARAVRFGVFLSERVDLVEYNRAYWNLVGGGPLPARMTIRTSFDRFDVEIDAVVEL